MRDKERFMAMEIDYWKRGSCISLNMSEMKCSCQNRNWGKGQCVLPLFLRACRLEQKWRSYSLTPFLWVRLFVSNTLTDTDNLPNQFVILCVIYVINFNLIDFFVCLKINLPIGITRICWSTFLHFLLLLHQRFLGSDQYVKAMQL